VGLALRAYLLLLDVDTDVARDALEVSNHYTKIE
jgi:hypothetical protein